MPSALDDVALFQIVPALAGEARLPWVRLGEWPTPVERLPALEPATGGGLWVKRDDLSGPRYGGNKIRTLEALFGQARAAGARAVWASGPYGSNHALATATYAREAGFEPGAILFPQPRTPAAVENLRATLALRPSVRALISVAGLPAAVGLQRLRTRCYVMVPGGATPEGALGYVSAGLELALQVRAGAMPAPDRIVLPAGSNCTTAGLLVGLAVAARLGIGFGIGAGEAPPPEVFAVRVTPWPVTARLRILGLARRTAALLARIGGDPRLEPPPAELAARLCVVGGFLGRGYGRPTALGLDAIERFRRAGGPALDASYSGKAAAALFRRPRAGVTLFWVTKNTRPLPELDAATLAEAPARLRRWLARPTVPPPT